jgi:hypothetical protein
MSCEGGLQRRRVMRGVRGQQDFHHHRPIEPGQTLVSRAVPLGVIARSTGAVVLGKAETRTDAGDLVVEQWMTYFVRGAAFGESVGEPLPEHGFPEPLRGTGRLRDLIGQRQRGHQGWPSSEIRG